MHCHCHTCCVRLMAPLSLAHGCARRLRQPGALTSPTCPRSGYQASSATVPDRMCVWWPYVSTSAISACKSNWESSQSVVAPPKTLVAAERHARRVQCLLQTAARVWDALLNEGPKVLFRVALALLKTSEAVLLKQDNVGLLLREIRQAVTHTHDRDKLMKVVTME